MFASRGEFTPLTKLQTFFFGIRFPCESIHSKDHLDLVSSDLNPPDEGTQHLAFALPV